MSKCMQGLHWDVLFQKKWMSYSPGPLTEKIMQYYINMLRCAPLIDPNNILWCMEPVALDVQAHGWQLPSVHRQG